MRWRSIVNPAQDIVHCLPDDGAHETSTFCWCNPTMAMLTREDKTVGLLISHRHDEEEE